MSPRDIERLDRLARLLDARFQIFGVRFGLDAVLGVIPGLGDAATLLPAAYLIVSAHRMGARKATLVRMTANTAVDMIAGAVPVLGDLFDLAFRANMRNIRLLRADLASRQDPRHAAAAMATA
ncbi:DUF4112 domain-containing protein [Breoghania sp. L-A4]|uniref:DUF4112 domain-containing protein n=1 Tax=Breoghania sp. L-A4 TaxID=2304600 RepID=UPI000E35FA94|nr:DUF4112 domain-containing protein [Breoghania sp. L-A4]AXS41911.1 DUF4112 domain-containing protein [Breoghania sp. L-A4]